MWLLIIAIGFLFWFFYEITRPFRKPKGHKFVKQFENFKKLGFKLNQGVEVRDLLEITNKKEYEKNPYSLLYMALGSEIQREPYTPMTDQVWNFDTEAIEDCGDYVRIMKNIRRIFGGELDFQNIKDCVDIENNKASVSFDLNGEKYSWNLQVEDDWVDSRLFSKIVELTEKYKTQSKLTAFSLGGQEVIIGWLNPEQLENVRKKTGLDIAWL